MGVKMNHHPRSCVTPNFPKWGSEFRTSDTQIGIILINFDQKPLQVCNKASLSKNLQWQSCSVINCLSKGVGILAGDDPVSVKFGPKDTDRQ